MLVYLDTSAWNALLDWSVGKSRKWLQGPEYLFSSCNLDEFSLASTARSRELAAYSWRLSNRQKLLDHLELSVAEVVAFQRDSALDFYDHRDWTFELAWRAMRTTGLTREMRQAMTAQLDTAKAEYRDWFRLGREVFNPLFAKYAKYQLNRTWPELLEELKAETDMRDGLRISLEDAGLLKMLPEPSRLDRVPWVAIPCTSCWLEYHMAMYYLASFDSKRLGRPDKGDQVDFRHAAYAGIADVYVTGDKRMHEILDTMIPSRRARVLLVPDYIDEMSATGSL